MGILQPRRLHCRFLQTRPRQTPYVLRAHFKRTSFLCLGAFPQPPIRYRHVTDGDECCRTPGTPSASLPSSPELPGSGRAERAAVYRRRWQSAACLCIAGHAGDTAGAAWPTQSVDIYSNRLSPGERYRSAWVTGARRDTTAAAAEARRAGVVAGTGVCRVNQCDVNAPSHPTSGVDDLRCVLSHQLRSSRPGITATRRLWHGAARRGAA